MGKQIHFYMLPPDQHTFLQMVRERDPVIVCLRDSDSADIQPVTDADIALGRTLCLWNHKLLPNLKRRWVSDPGYYRIDGLKTPTLEFMPSFAATWEGRPALGQGRLFGDFDQYLEKPPAFESWYRSLVRWLQQHYVKSPVTTGGYVGPAAFEFYEGGGFLLPNFLPPQTKEWLSEINKQHPA
jgi:hypothetical protein